MKYSFLVLITFFLFACSLNENKVKLLDHGKTSYHILLSENADSLTNKAATELQHYLYKISGHKLKIVNNADSGSDFVKIGKELIPENSIASKLVGLKRDGFLIETSRNDLILAGMNSRATLYAVYTFLEEYLGCMKFPYGEEYVPKSKDIAFPNIHKIYNPSFSYRHIHFHDKEDYKLTDWYRIENLDEWGMYVHTFQRLMPPDEYFDEHPEYFSLVNGRRIKDGQLCLSNPDVIRLLKENLRQQMDKKPGYNYWSVSQNDCINYCECEECQNLYEKYGNISGAYIQMANNIATKFPDKQISTLAYQFTRSAPKNIQPLDNVNIMFCSIECNRSMPLADDPRSQDFVQDMKDWSNLTDNIYMWDYVVQFENFLCPFPNVHTLQPNIRFFKDHNVDMIFEQGSSSSWSDMKELKLFLLSKLAWNVDANVDSLTDRFFNIYYREAARPIRKYFNLTQARTIEKQKEQFLNIYGFPVEYTTSFLKPDYMLEYKALMDSAEMLAGKDSVVLKRVWRTRLAIDFAYLDLALNYNSPLLTYIIEKDGQKQLDPDMLAYLDRLVELGHKCSVTRVNEKSLTLEDYRKLSVRNLHWKLLDNLAKSAEIKILTTYSEKYPVGGEKSLSDGLFGGLHFSYNWLGFENENMEVLLDFGKPADIKKISMNFLKALVSWIFLPKEILVEASNDGKNFQLLGNTFPDVENRNFRVESVPFTFEFPGTETRYLRITAKSIKTCPEWHRGYGQPAWIFVDEIVVE